MATPGLDMSLDAVIAQNNEEKKKKRQEEQEVRRKKAGEKAKLAAAQAAAAQASSAGARGGKAGRGKGNRADRKAVVEPFAVRPQSPHSFAASALCCRPRPAIGRPARRLSRGIPLEPLRRRFHSTPRGFIPHPKTRARPSPVNVPR